MGLSINIRSASSDALDSQVSRAITLLAAQVNRRQRHSGLPPGPGLDVTFMLPGKFDKPGFNGMRMGGFTDREGVLHFETAVPESLVQSREALRYVELTLQDVIDNANDFFVQNYRDFDQQGWQEVLDQLAQGMFK